ncbi:hypothetical protein PPL_02504 [Heterostelium album PN500]|uniref:Uncharacterized protein n=1 Tax=Heterostelium pallidum (strain ATCC 26659 / Pp 5 / PN500) TaxID=670386 RepID=D3B295_HETP5|nr:hypothetical protein PPL_02504 [Heterostelium album PN500]EFA84470.1 hypothetical protein PPL_02504 [Heterostelium album PN500]|eukprot:XP_020436584.1 hypothetical protein PPL_02504 [Heterostelium album PN500]
MVYCSDSNNNKSEIFVNLPHVLLSKIVQCLDDNIDKIVFTLVCKRWFDDKDRYLTFNTNTINIIDDKDNHFYLNSYRSSINNSLNQKTNCKLIINDVGRSGHDYSLSTDKLEETTDIPSNVDTVLIDRSIESLSTELTEKLYHLISNSNVITLKNCIVGNQLPLNLKSISFGVDHDEPIDGILPPNLKQLKFGESFSQRILVGSLPATLEKLTLPNAFTHEFEEGALPTALKVLKFERGSAYEQPIHRLPPNLEEFHYNGPFGVPEIGNEQLPDTLRSLYNVPASWLHSIKSLSNLTTLTFNSKTKGLETPIDLSLLPTSLTRLHIDVPWKLESAMPTTIRYLNIVSAKYDIDEIFRDRSQYQFEELIVHAFKNESLDGLKIRQLKLEFYSIISIPSREFFTWDDKVIKSSVLRSIPNGVEILHVGICNSDFKLGSLIPLSVKTIIFHNQMGSIPTSIEEMILQQDIKSFNYDNLPPAVRSLTIKSIEFDINLNGIPQTLDNLCIKTKRRYSQIFSLRKINNHHYLLFGQSDEHLNAAIINVSDIKKFKL